MWPVVPRSTPALRLQSEVGRRLTTGRDTAAADPQVRARRCKPGVAAWTVHGHGRRALTAEGLYGRRKMTVHLRRTGLPEASAGAVDRAMRLLGLSGVRRDRGIRTTILAKDGKRAGDLLNRDFTAPAPNRVWVADFENRHSHRGRPEPGHVDRHPARRDLVPATGQYRPVRSRPALPEQVGGGFNRSSQHLDREVSGGRFSGLGDTVTGGRRCGRLVGRRWLGVSIGSGFGRGLLGD